jgi:hypothetical protein
VKTFVRGHNRSLVLDPVIIVRAPNPVEIMEYFSGSKLQTNRVQVHILLLKNPIKDIQYNLKQR